MTDDGRQHHDEYDDDFVAGLEWIWGEGFLSPGGRAEVARILRGIDVAGKRVLDIGCGVGGIDVVLVREHGAAGVVGIDIEQPLIDKANARLAGSGLEEVIEFKRVSAGPLEFADASFDIVFSKDALIHVRDKAAIYSEIFRVLKPGGWLAMSDWFGCAEPETAALKEWLQVVKLSFRMGTLPEAVDLIAEIGFVDIDSEDRNAWYRQEIKAELATMSDENYPRLVEHLGAAAAEQRVRSTTIKKTVVDQGQLRPGHLRARKPL